MLLSSNAETGSNGAAVTAGTDFDIVNKGTTGTHTYKSSSAVKGSLGYESVAGSGNTYLGWSTALGGTKTVLWTRLYGRVDAYYSGSFCHVRSSGALAGKVGITSSGKLNIADGNGIFIATGTTVIPTGVPFRVEFHVAAGAANAGTIEARLYTSMDSNTPAEVLGPFTTQTATQFDQIWFGPVGGTAGAATLHHDDIVASDSGWIGASGAVATAPSCSTSVSISGTAQQSQTLTGNSGAWTGSPTPTFTYRWLRCDASGNNPQAIAGATSTQYVVTAIDIGSTLRFEVTGTNSAGSSTVTSSATTIVTAPPTTSILLQNTADGSNGVAVSTGNSGGALGSPFDTITISAGGAVTYDTSANAGGTSSIKAASQGVSAYVGWTSTSLGTQSDIYARMYLRFAAYPSAGAAVMRFASGANTTATINVTNTGQLRIRNSAGTLLGSGTSTIPLNQWVRLEAHVQPSASSGTVNVRLYLQANSSTINETVNVTNAALTATVDEVDFGLIRNASAGDIMWFDELATADSWIGPNVDTARRWGWGMVAKPGTLPDVGPTTRTAADVIWGSNLYTSYGPYFGYNESASQVVTRTVNTYGGFGMSKVFPNTLSSFNYSLEGQTPGKRSMVCTRYDQVALANGTYDSAIRNYVRSIPANWYIILVNWQEPDAEMLKDNVFTPAQHVAASNHMADIVHDEIANNTLASGVTCEVWDCFEEYTVNVGYNGQKWSDTFAALRTDGISWDLYGNPNGSTTGARVNPAQGYRSAITGNNYGVGTTSSDPRKRVLACRDIAQRNGFTKFGFVELGAPFRQDDVFAQTGLADGAKRAEWFEKCYDAIIESGAIVGLIFNAIGTNFDQRLIVGPNTNFVDGSPGGKDATILTGPNWNPSSRPSPDEEPTVTTLRSYISQTL